MLEVLRAWLNGTREYNSGVLLYCQLGNDADLKTIFKKGKTDYCNKRLQQELLVICADMKAKIFPDDTKPDQQGDPAAEQNKKRQKENPRTSAGATPVENIALYESCKRQADKAYKEVMNTRALLFSSLPDMEFMNPNRQDLVYARQPQALEVVRGYNEASRLYDIADFVKLHGRLPDTAPTEDEELLQVPDHQVKQKLDNLRKNYNKTKVKEQTPERVELLQKQERHIKIMESRWHSLQSKK